MHRATFTGLGTHWSVSVDGDEITQQLIDRVDQYLKDFEERFSRFRPHSETNQFRNSIAGTYPVSKELHLLLSASLLLRRDTHGAFDPAIGSLMEHAGYDASYRFTPDDVEQSVVVGWTLEGVSLSIGGPTVFDFGGIAKGYCIDRVADIVREEGCQFFLVDGGGDMVATTKEDGASWRIALEWPGRPDLAAGVYELKNQGLAASDRFRRQWGTWHHIVSANTKLPVEGIAGCIAVAQNAWDADRMTSALALGDTEDYLKFRQQYGAEYLLFGSDGVVHVSSNWQGELFA